MVSLRTPYAGELAVLSTWLCALLPWSLSFVSARGISFVVVRWPFFLVRFIFGVTVPGEQPFQTVVGALAFEDGAIAQAYRVWLVGAALFLVALGLSIAYYAREERVEAALPADPVRMLGGLLLASGLVLGVSTALLIANAAAGAVPIGVLFLLVLGTVLLLVERVEEAAAG